jgi:hemolysin activation/secretion protein
VMLCCAGIFLAASPAANAQTRFDIQRFVVEGNTILAEAEIRRLVSPFEGKSRDFGDVQRALEALQDEFLARGYTAVRVLVPEQDLVGGLVRIQVVQARISEVRVEGNQFFDSANVRASLPALKEGESPNTRAISQNVVLVNENPAKQVGISLEPTKEAGNVDAVVRVTDSKPSRWSLSLDNTGSSATGYHRSGLAYQNANVFNRDHVLNMQYITSPDHIGDVTIFGLGYRAPVYASKGFFDVFGGYSDVNSGTIQNLFTVSGSGTILGARYTQVLPKLDAYEQRIALGYDYRDFRNNVSFVGTSGSLLPDITIRPVSLTYTGRLPQVGRDIAFYATYLTNTPGGADGGQDAFSAQRAGANARYQIWRYGASYSQALPADYLLRAAFSAQYTRDLLIPGEQFGMGGADSVRGYLERETASDLGQRLSLEAYTPDLGGRFSDTWKMRALAFYDTARGHDRIPARVPVNEINGLASVGAGLRMTQGRSVSARLDYAHVLNAAGTRPVGKDRVHFAVVYSF